MTDKCLGKFASTALIAASPAALIIRASSKQYNNISEKRREERREEERRENSLILPSSFLLVSPASPTLTSKLHLFLFGQGTWLVEILQQGDQLGSCHLSIKDLLI